MKGLAAGVAVLLLLLLVLAITRRGRRRDAGIAELLELPWTDGSLPVEAVTERPTWVARAVVDAADAAARRVDPEGELRRLLQRARVPLRPGELVVLTASGAVVLAALVVVLTETLLLGLLGLVAAPALVAVYLRRRVKVRQQAILEAFPDALGLVVASLLAGHTFLRAIQLLREDAEPALAEELSLVVAECELGTPLPDALERMANRVQIRDVAWAVQAIRIQESTGGRLADVLATIAEFMRARQEVRRDVAALSAEGRMSAWVLAALPVVLVLALQVSSPDYLQPMFRGWGLVTLAGAAASTALGMKLIFCMVDSIEV